MLRKSLGLDPDSRSSGSGLRFLTGSGSGFNSIRDPKHCFSVSYTSDVLAGLNSLKWLIKISFNDGDIWSIQWRQCLRNLG